MSLHLVKTTEAADVEQELDDRHVPNVRDDRAHCLWCHQRPRYGSDYCSRSWPSGETCEERHAGSKPSERIHPLTARPDDVPDVSEEPCERTGLHVELVGPPVVGYSTDIYAALAKTSEIKQARSMEKDLRAYRWALRAAGLVIALLIGSML